jgi:hypothetical protein
MSFLRIIGVVFGLLLLVVSGGIALFSFLDNPSMSDDGQVFGTIVLVGVAVLGVFLVRWSSREFFGKVVRSPAGLGRWPIGLGRWLLLPGTRSHPVGMVIWTLLIALVPLALAPRGGVRMLIALVAFLTYMLFAIMLFAMIALAAMPRWWWRALSTLLLGPVVMTGLIVMAESFETKVVGEAALAFLGPLMWSWAIIPVTGLIRLAVSRPSAPPDRSGQAL